MNITTFPNWIIIIWIVALPVMVFFIIYIDVDIPVIIISGSSMTPALLPGDLVLVKKEHINDIKIDDIIAFKSDGEVYRSSTNEVNDGYYDNFFSFINNNDDSGKYKTVVHRVVNIDRDENNSVFLTTGGDFNFQNDDEVVTESNYVGKVYFAIPKLGNTINLLKNPVVITIIISVMVLFYFYDKKGLKQ